MREALPDHSLRVAVAAALATVLLAACRPKSPETPPAPVPPAPEVASEVRTAVPVGPAPVATVAVGQSAAPMQDNNGKHAAPPVEKMQRATASSKLGVPVDLRYQFEDAVQEGRPAVLHLAAVPRVEGSNLSISIKDAPGIEASAAAVTAQKAAASQAYRQQLSVTRHAGAPAELRVLVTMDLAEGSAFGYFSVPFGNPDSAR